MHTPYVVILYKYLHVWKQLHQSAMPKNFKEKLAFKELVRTGKSLKDEPLNIKTFIKCVFSLIITVLTALTKCLINNNERCAWRWILLYGLFRKT